MFSKKKKPPASPEFDIAGETWPRHEFEVLKETTLGNDRPLKFELTEAVRSFHLTPGKYKDPKSFEYFEFHGVSEYPALIVEVTFDDEDSLEINTNPQSENRTVIDSGEYVGAMVLVGTGFSDDDERLFKRNYRFRRKVNQQYLPGLEIHIFGKYRYRQIELFRAAQNAKLNGGMLEVRIGFDKKLGLNCSWEEFKKLEEGFATVPIAELRFGEYVPFRNEYYGFHKDEFDVSPDEQANFEAIHLERQKKYEST